MKQLKVKKRAPQFTKVGVFDCLVFPAKRAVKATPAAACSLVEKLGPVVMRSTWIVVAAGVLALLVNTVLAK